MKKYLTICLTLFLPFGVFSQIYLSEQSQEVQLVANDTIIVDTTYPIVNGVEVKKPYSIQSKQLLINFKDSINVKVGVLRGCSQIHEIHMNHSDADQLNCISVIFEDIDGGVELAFFELVLTENTRNSGMDWQRKTTLNMSTIGIRLHPHSRFYEFTPTWINNRVLRIEEHNLNLKTKKLFCFANFNNSFDSIDCACISEVQHSGIKLVKADHNR